MTVHPSDIAGWLAVNPIDPEDPFLWSKVEHLGRYLFAARFLEQAGHRVVADVGCGYGYGVGVLLEHAERVIAIDRDPQLLELAAQQYPSPRVKTVQACLDTGTLLNSIPPGSIDMIVCFETLEHLVEPKRAVREFAGLLSDSGHLICSVPDAANESRDPAGLPMNTYHKQLFSFASLSSLLTGAGFRIDYRLGQAWANRAMKRESRLKRDRVIESQLGDSPHLNTPEMIRLLAHIFGYPSVEDIDGSYSIVVVASKDTTTHTG